MKDLTTPSDRRPKEIMRRLSKDGKNWIIYMDNGTHLILLNPFRPVDIVNKTYVFVADWGNDTE